jgi:hypothetical protein
VGVCGRGGGREKETIIKKKCLNFKKNVLIIVCYSSLEKRYKLLDINPKYLVVLVCVCL